MVGGDEKKKNKTNKLPSVEMISWTPWEYFARI